MGRSPCCEKAHTNKGAWTKHEDQRLINYIRLNGEGSWRSLPKAAGLLRCGKSCRLRWINYLRPDVKRGNFSEEEEEVIIKLHALLGNKWSLIAGRLPGRTDNEIKNYWNTHIKRKLISRGLDPQTHCPLTATTTTTNTRAAANNICLDFRNTSTSSLSSQPTKVKHESNSIEDAKCSSGTTEEAIHPQQQQEQQKQTFVIENDRKPLLLDLNLSIGMPSQGESMNSAESTQLVMSARSSEMALVAQAVCLCFQLGLHKGQICSNCQHTNELIGYY